MVMWSEFDLGIFYGYFDSALKVYCVEDNKSFARECLHFTNHKFFRFSWLTLCQLNAIFIWMRTVQYYRSSDVKQKRRHKAAQNLKLAKQNLGTGSDNQQVRWQWGARPRVNKIHLFSCPSTYSMCCGSKIVS